MLQVGVIGCGRIAQMRHLPEYADSVNVRIAGVVDLNMERAKEIARKYHAKAYASYQELLGSSGIDAVSVCTFNNTHAEIAIAALNAGKHVLCEKPMATNLEEAEEWWPLPGPIAPRKTTPLCFMVPRENCASMTILSIL